MALENRKDTDIDIFYEKSEETKFVWLISADNIFESRIKGYEKYARFFYWDFSISKLSLFDEKRLSDSCIFAKDIKVYLEPSRFCASIQCYLTNGYKIPKLTMQKVITRSNIIEMKEKVECEECYIQSFERTREVACFSFRCTGYSDSYQDFGVDGKKLGKAATKISLTTWKSS